MTMPGGWELIVILFIILLLFGARKLPDLAGSMGKSIKEFRKATRDAMDDEDSDDGTDGDSDVTKES
ncbi:MAG: twin-arginine translocase TatA/TatE family subunit [Nitriliruptoraceae bacterium]